MTETKIQIVKETRHCRQIVSALLREPVLAVDCEGIQLGADGPLTLLQVGTYSGDVYLFDVQENKHLLTDGRLKNLLESSKIVKVIHACSNDSAALFHQFNVTLENVFDTQVADIVLEEHRGRLLPPPLKLQTVCEKYSNAEKVSEYKDELKTQWCKIEGDLWAKRPLTEEMMSYAAGDVRALIPEVYEEQNRLLEKSGLQKIFKERVLEAVYISIDPETKTKRRERIDDRVREIIDSIEENWDKSTKLSDFPDDGDEVRALKRINDKEAREKSDFIDQLKTESILCDLKELEEEMTEEGSEYVVKGFTHSILSRILNHPDKKVSEKARDLKRKLEDVMLRDIEVKYSLQSSLTHMSYSEKDVLRTLTPKSTKDPRFSGIILHLYWTLMEEDLDRKCEAFGEKGKDFNMKERYYKKLRFYVASGANVPDSLKRKARIFKRQLDSKFGRDVVPEFKGKKQLTVKHR